MTPQRDVPREPQTLDGCRCRACGKYTLAPLSHMCAASFQPIDAAPPAPAAPAEPTIAPHVDDLGVDRFAAAMKTKLAEKRAEGYGGWNDADECPPGHLAQLLRDHLPKGDPLDIGNFAMMLWNRGESCALPAAPAPDADGLVARLNDVLRNWTNVSDDEQAVIRDALALIAAQAREIDEDNFEIASLCERADSADATIAALRDELAGQVRAKEAALRLLGDATQGDTGS